MPAQRLKEYLDDNGVKYVAIKHSPAFTAQEVAQTAHIPGDEMAKTVIIRIDGEPAMAVLPASYLVDFESLKSAIGASSVSLATESEFRSLFPECELGAMPPFGNLYGIDVYVAERLASDEMIAFNACSHHEVYRLAYKDFARLVQPKVIRFATR